MKFFHSHGEKFHSVYGDPKTTNSNTYDSITPMYIVYDSQQIYIDYILTIKRTNINQPS